MNILISHNCSRQIRYSESVGRWGGEELMIICAATNEKNAVTLAGKLFRIIGNADFPTVGRNSVRNRGVFQI